ncbi:MAG: DUF4082 domain-containing protein, partial [Planctomycetes bacterium]|nr:DUF4082 domain-containing protein [Planctomycetota bacterium]
MQQADPTTTGGQTYSGGGWNLGYHFNCNASNVTVTHLAACSPSAGTRIVTLWDSTTQGVIGQVTTANGAAGAWRTGALATPVTLVNGRNYVVAVLTDTTHGYYGITNTANAVWHPTSGPILHQGDKWVSTTNPNTYPTSSSGASWWHFGLADIGYTTGPAVSASTNSINLGTTPQGTPGTAVSYTISGSQLSTFTTITAPTGVNVSFSQSSGYAQSIQYNTFPSYTNVTIWARLTGATAGTVTGNITHTSTGATSANVAVSGTVTGPTISTSTSSLNLGSTPQGTPGSA